MGSTQLLATICILSLKTYTLQEIQESSGLVGIYIKCCSVIKEFKNGYIRQIG